MSQDTPRYHRFRWRWFWAVFVLVLATYAGFCIWTHYQEQRWNHYQEQRWLRARSLELAAKSFRDEDPPTVIAKLSQPTSSTKNGPKLTLKYGPPDYPLRLEFQFVHGRLSSSYCTAMPRYHMHPGAEDLILFNEIALAISIPLWLVLVIGAYIECTKLVSHLLLATALFALAVGVSLGRLSPIPWLLGTIAVAVGILAIRSTYRTPKDDATPVCDECGYNLTGNISGICPECGTPVPAETRETFTGNARSA